jgi:hypothetical protein
MWTTELPKVAGYYWAVRKGETEPEVVKIAQVSINTKVYNCWTTRAGNLDKAYNFTRWFGPIPEPKDD